MTLLIVIFDKRHSLNLFSNSHLKNAWNRSSKIINETNTPFTPTQSKCYLVAPINCRVFHRNLQNKYTNFQDRTKDIRFFIRKVNNLQIPARNEEVRGSEVLTLLYFLTRASISDDFSVLQSCFSSGKHTRQSPTSAQSGFRGFKYYRTLSEFARSSFQGLWKVVFEGGHFCPQYVERYGCMTTTKEMFREIIFC